MPCSAAEACPSSALAVCARVLSTIHLPPPPANPALAPQEFAPFLRVLGSYPMDMLL